MNLCGATSTSSEQVQCRDGMREFELIQLFAFHRVKNREKSPSTRHRRPPPASQDSKIIIALLSLTHICVYELTHHIRNHSQIVKGSMKTFKGKGSVKPLESWNQRPTAASA